MTTFQQVPLQPLELLAQEICGPSDLHYPVLSADIQVSMYIHMFKIKSLTQKKIVKSKNVSTGQIKVIRHTVWSMKHIE